MVSSFRQLVLGNQQSLIFTIFIFFPSSPFFYGRHITKKERVKSVKIYVENT